MHPIFKLAPPVRVAILVAAIVVGGRTGGMTPAGAASPLASKALVGHSTTANATISSATDAKGNQTIDLRKVTLKTTTTTVRIIVTAYQPVPDKTLSHCGDILVSLNRTASVVMTGRAHGIHARIKDGSNTSWANVSRPNEKTFSIEINRDAIPSYPATGTWLVAAEGGGFCSGPQLQDTIPDRGRIAP